MGKLFKDLQFKELGVYFKNLSFGDLIFLDQEDLFAAAKPEHKLLMRIFAKKKLEEFWNREKTQPFQRQTISSENKTTAEEKSKNPFDFSGGKLVTSTFFGMTNPSPGKTFVNEMSPPDPNWTTLNLSSNNLLDEDVSHIKNYVDPLNKLEILDLSWNRIYGKWNPEVDRNLIAIAKKPSIKFIVVVGNPIASIDRADFLQNLEDWVLKKLVWIPEHWIEAGGWKGLVRPGQKEIVLQTHESFYRK